MLHHIGALLWPQLCHKPYRAVNTILRSFYQLCCVGNFINTTSGLPRVQVLGRSQGFLAACTGHAIVVAVIPLGCVAFGARAGTVVGVHTGSITPLLGALFQTSA
jgi:hypothetical protein